MTTVLLARQLLTPLQVIDDSAVAIDHGVISGVGKRDEVLAQHHATIVDLGDAVLTPGLIDIHVHGGAGYDVMQASDESLAAIEASMARHGVTSYCPTTVTAPIDATLHSLQRLGQACNRERSASEPETTRARPLGIHLEGPFLSHAKRGVHPPNLLRPPSLELFEKMWEAAAGTVRVLTIAPELEGAAELIAEATARGVCVSLGHSNATLAEANAGIRAGARHATHTFNAMRPLDHREPGLLGAVLTDPNLSADIIADGIHVDPSVVDLFVRAKGVNAAVLITDGISATGMPDGTYKLGGLTVEVRGGRCESEGRLAGSVLTLDCAVRNICQYANLSFLDGVRMATLNPARVLGMESRKGVLQKGADADFAVFARSGEVLGTIVGGKIASRALFAPSSW